MNGVGQVLVLGGRGRQINVWLDAARLRAYNVTVTDVSRALQAQNVEIPGGRVEQGPQNAHAAHARARRSRSSEFGEIVVRDARGASDHGRRRGDASRTAWRTPSTLASVERHAGRSCCNIRRQSGTNAVRGRADRQGPARGTARDAAARLRRSRSSATRATSSRRRSARVEEHLIVGALLAALVVLLFLGNWRSTIIAAIAIPTSIIATFGLIWYQGFTLNSMTMLGAHARRSASSSTTRSWCWRTSTGSSRRRASRRSQAAVEATREIGLAVLATTLSLVAIFLPVGFMGGIVGRFMKSFGLTMAFAVDGVAAGQLHADADARRPLAEGAPRGGRRGAPGAHLARERVVRADRSRLHMAARVGAGAPAASSCSIAVAGARCRACRCS